MQLQRLKNEIEEEIKKFNSLHKKAQELASARSSLLEQEGENALVLGEMEQLPENAKVFKQVGSVLIDQTRKEAVATLSHRIAHIRTQLLSTNTLISKNEQEQKQMTEKIQKAKEAFVQMSQQQPMQ